MSACTEAPNRSVAFESLHGSDTVKLGNHQRKKQMKPQFPGLILAYLLIPVGVAIVFAALGLVAVIQTYDDAPSTVNLLLVVLTGIIAAAIPFTVSFKRVRHGPLIGFWQVLTGVSGALVLAFGGYSVLAGEDKVVLWLVVPVALGAFYLAAETALLARGVADKPDTP